MSITNLATTKMIGMALGAQGNKLKNPIISQNQKRRPIVTFTLDDGCEADYSKIKPLSVKYGVPFVDTVILSKVDAIGMMSKSQLLELQDTYGWEITSHTNSHLQLATLSTETEIDYEHQSSKLGLIALGLNVKNIIYPNGSNDERVRMLARKYYRSACKVSDPIVKINSGIIPSYAISRVSLGSFFDAPTTQYPITNTFKDYYKLQIDEAVAKNGWLVFMLHPAQLSHYQTQQSYLEQSIQYIKSLNVDILTLDQGYDIFGNAFESGDYTGVNSENGIAISKDGQIDGK